MMKDYGPERPKPPRNKLGFDIHQSGQESRIKHLETDALKLNQSEIKPLNDFSDIMLEMVKDERISESIRLEYTTKIIEKLAKPKYIMNFRGEL